MMFNSPKFLFSVSALNSLNNSEFQRLYESYLNSSNFQVSGFISQDTKDGKSFTKFNVYEVKHD